MSTAEKIFKEAQSLTPSAQATLLQLVQLLAQQPTLVEKFPAKAGTAKGLVEISPDFDEPLEDFKPYMQ